MAGGTLSDGTPDWDGFLRGLREGDSAACEAFWSRYGAALEGIAARQLSARLKQRVGPDDIVQSVCRTFFRRMAGGQFDVPDADALWRLMCSITITKARRAARDHRRLKRGMQQEMRLGDPGGTTGAPEPAADVEGPESGLELADQLDALIRGLGDEECQVLDLKMNNMDNEQIAAQLGCSERTVRRLVNKIQTRWHAMMDELAE